MSRDWKLFLQDMKRSCDRILNYVEGMDRIGFFNDQKTVDAVLRNLEIIGEASKKIALAIQLEWPEIPWRRIGGMRNWLAHAYFGIEEDFVWNVVEDHIPGLKQSLVKILGENF